MRETAFSAREFVGCRHSLPHREVSSGGTLDPHPQTAACTSPRMNRQFFSFVSFRPQNAAFYAALRYQRPILQKTDAADKKQKNCFVSKRSVSAALFINFRPYKTHLPHFQGGNSGLADVSLLHLMALGSEASPIRFRTRRRVRRDGASEGGFTFVNFRP